MRKNEGCRKMLVDPGLSGWFKRSRLSTLDRYPVDAGHDAGSLPYPARSRSGVGSA